MDDWITSFCYSFVMLLGCLNSVTFVIRKDLVNKYFILFGYRSFGPDRVSVSSNTIFEPPVIVGIETRVQEVDAEPQNLF
ncbi:hypothetical protein HDV01_003055 [Terramyces sp. JEL0728]|nr:hypothetical protein HDV01_003055 [Terramyces sp. JEL0728]